VAGWLRRRNLPSKRLCFNLHVGGLDPAPSRVLEPYLLRSDAFPAAEWGTVVAASHRQEAPEQLVSDPRRFRLEDAGEG
jgi:hypothetical protein